MDEYALPEIISCGYCTWRVKPGDIIKTPERISNCIEIEMFLEDGVISFINGKEHKVLKNHIIIAKEGSKRCSILPYVAVYLKISASGMILDTLNNLPDCFPSVRTEQILDLFNEIILLNNENIKNNFLIGAKILLLIDLLIKDANYSGTLHSTYSVLHKSKKFIEKNYNKKISTTDIAASVNLSEPRFRFLFGELYGISPHQYLKNVRISNAKRLLLEGNFTLCEIAEKCGFSCQQYFTKIFKLETGISPGKYKKEFEYNYNN